MTKKLFRHQLQLGDIVLCKTQGSFKHGLIRFGQRLAYNMHGSNRYVHAQIVVRGADGEAELDEDTQDVFAGHPNGSLVAQSHIPENANVHITIDPQTSPGTVFRLRAGQENDTLRAEAAKVAVHLCGRAQANLAFAHYGRGRATGSLLRRGNFGDKARNLIARVENEDADVGFFCSMYVTLCYQIAFLKGESQRPFPIAADAMAMQPAALHGYLRHHSSVWDYAGELCAAPVAKT